MSLLLIAAFISLPLGWLMARRSDVSAFPRIVAWAALPPLAGAAAVYALLFVYAVTVMREFGSISRDAALEIGIKGMSSAAIAYAAGLACAGCGAWLASRTKRQDVLGKVFE